MTFPIWYNAALGEDKGRPEVVKPQSGQCVESTEYMMANHMQLLNEWRNWYVRDEDHYYTSAAGHKHKMSLTNTCFSSQCHSNVSEFCDRCHDYVGVQPYCFDCHLIPKDR